MGFDNDTKLIRTETYGMLISRFIKNNTPQIAISLPLVIAFLSAFTNFIIYFIQKGYYEYFNLDDSFMLVNSKITIYQSIIVFFCFFVYWIYSIFTVRMCLIKNNWLYKVIFTFYTKLHYSVYRSWNSIRN